MPRDVLEEYLGRDKVNPFVLIAFFALSIAGAVWEEIVGIWRDEL